MTATAHRIGSIRFEIGASDAEAVRRFSARLGSAFNGLVAPVLNDVLDRLGRADAVVRVDRVDIDLGAFDPADDAWVGRIGELLGEALLPAITGSGGIIGGADDTLTARTSVDAARDPGFERTGDGLIDEFIGFLRSGILARPSARGALQALMSAIAALDRDAFARCVHRLAVVLLQQRAFERLLNQVPAHLVRRTLSALAAQVLAMPSLIDFALEGRDDRPLPLALHDSARRLVRVLVQPGSTADAAAVVALLATINAAASADGDWPSTEQARPAVIAEDADAASLAGLGDAIPVDSAGFVLLHPFLAPFFGRLGLLEHDGGFRDLAAQQRGVLLAHHVATGADSASEVELPVFKLLCGLPLAQPVPQTMDLSDTERDETLGLLCDVIHHWHRLGKTSPQGLREGFLVRPGQLLHGDTGWQLRVETSGIDMLLDHLPWTLSRVKTPFMRDVLHVDWR